MKGMTILLGLVMLSVLPLIIAEQTNAPTQQYNKIFLNPFYRVSMTNNLNYTSNFSITPPDGISQMTSAIVSLQVYLTPTVTFWIWVNGTPCNTPNYTVSTTYASSGQGLITFDCSNVIKGEGFYNVTIRPVGANTGASTAWVDLTYMNKPSANIQIYGTEYQVGDNGRMFIQLLANSSTAINNASCFATVYYPNNVKWYDKVAMTYQTGSNGLYYFDFTTPTTTGVYMTEAYCQYYTSVAYSNATAYAMFKGRVWYGNGTSLTAIDNDWLNMSERNYQPGFNFSTVSTVLMAHLDEETGTAAEDSSPSASNGTHYNSPTLAVPSLLGAAVKYDGANDYTNFPQASKFNLNTTDAFMYCFTMNQSASNPNGDRILDSLGATSEGVRISFDGGNQIRFVSDRSGTAAQTIQTATTYIDSTWHTVCAFANFTTMQLWIDGSLVVNDATKTQSGSMTTINGISLAAVSTGNSNFADVALDEVCFLKGTFTGTGQTIPNLVANYHGNKSCGAGEGILDFNVTIPSVTAYNNTTYFEIVTTYVWNQVNEHMTVYIYNYTLGGWLKLTNNLTYSLAPSTVSSQIISNITDFLNGGTVLLKFNDTNTVGPVDNLDINQVRVDQISYVQTPITEIRGSGEIHVSDYVSHIPEQVWNYTNRTVNATATLTLTAETYANVSDYVWNNSNRSINYTDNIALAIWGYNGTIAPNIIQQIVNATWSYTGTISNDIITQIGGGIAAQVWEFNGNSSSYMVQMVVNSTWSATARYTHGVVLS